LFRLNVPPGTNGDAQQLSLPLGPQVLPSPLQLTGEPHTPAEQTGFTAAHAITEPQAPAAVHD